MRRHDLWNDGYAVDVTSSTSSCPTTTCSTCTCTTYNITAIVCGITIPLVSIIIALVVVIIMLYRQKKAEPMTTSTARAMAEVQSSTSINPVAAKVVDDESQQYTQSPLGK